MHAHLIEHLWPAAERPATWPERASVFLAVVLPFAPRLVPLALVLLGAAIVRQRLLSPGTRWNWPNAGSAMPWMFLFFLVHVVGMAWTTDSAAGSFNLEVKTSFAIIPLLMVAWPRGMPFARRAALRAFLLANAACVLVCVAAACLRHAFGRWCGAVDGLPASEHYFGSLFSLFIHPSYFALYLCTSLAVLFQGGAWRRSPLRWNSAVAAVLVLGVLLCGSKMGWLVLPLVFVHALFAAGLPRRLQRRLLTVMAVAAVGLTGLLLGYRSLGAKVTQAIAATGPIDPASDQSSQLRRMAWDTAGDLFMEHPWTGVGTGDVADALIDGYRQRGYIHAEAKALNAHSQLFQTAAALGLPATLLLMAMLLLPLGAAVRMRDGLAIAFLALCLLNWSVECMAEVQAGVVFFATLSLWLELGRGGAGLRYSRS